MFETTNPRILIFQFTNILLSTKLHRIIALFRSLINFTVINRTPNTLSSIHTFPSRNQDRLFSRKHQYRDRLKGRPRSGNNASRRNNNSRIISRSHYTIINHASSHFRGAGPGTDVLDVEGQQVAGPGETRFGNRKCIDGSVHDSFCAVTRLSMPPSLPPWDIRLRYV